MIKSLEGIRGIAALIVAMYHLGIGAEHLSVIRNGYLFVDLFFVLSGFVICNAYVDRLQSGKDLKVFVIRRFGRLFPLLVFSTAFFIVVANAIVLAKNLALSHGFSSYLHHPEAVHYLIPSAKELLATLTMTHGLGVLDYLALNTPSWSISTEFFTYLLFAGLCLLPRTLLLRSVMTLSVVGLAVSIWASTTVHACLSQGGCLSLTYDYGFARCVHSFFLGALLCWIGPKIRFNRNWLQLAGLVTLGLLLAFVDPVPALGFGFPLAFACLILGLRTDQGPLASLMKLPLAQTLGQRSYSIYMMHMPLILVFGNLEQRADSASERLLVLLVYVTCLYILSGWTYRYVEDPLRKRFNRLAAARPAASENTAPAQTGSLPS